MLDNKTQEKLDAILKKEASILGEEEKSFLRARRSYISEADAEKFSEVLNESQTQKEKVVEEIKKVEVEEAKPKKKISKVKK